MKEQFFRIREDLCPYDPYTGEKRKNKITLHKDDIVLQKSECLTHMFGSYYKVQYGIYDYDVEVEYLKPIKENTEEYNKAYEEYHKVLDKQIEERNKERDKEMKRFDLQEEINKRCKKNPEFKKIWDETENYYDLIFKFTGIRQLNKYTLTDLEKLSGINHTTICNYEKRKRIPNILAFSKLLNVMGYELCIRKKDDTK